MGSFLQPGREIAWAMVLVVLVDTIRLEHCFLQKDVQSGYIWWNRRQASGVLLDQRVVL